MRCWLGASPLGLPALNCLQGSSEGMWTNAPPQFWQRENNDGRKKGEKPELERTNKSINWKKSDCKGRSSLFSLWNYAVTKRCISALSADKKLGFRSGCHHFHTPIVNGNLILPDKGDIYSRKHLQTTVFPRIYFPFFPSAFPRKVSCALCWALLQSILNHTWLTQLFQSNRS